MVGIKEKLSIKGVGWTARTPLSPIPKMEFPLPIHTKLNARWNTSYDRKQWYFKFSKIWSSTIPPKVSTHMWLIKRQGLWMCAKALREGIGDGRCRRCRTEVETIHHLFMGCKHNTLMISMLNRILGAANRKEASWKQFLLGDSVGSSTSMWNTIRACFLWHIWLQRNAAVFDSVPPSLSNFLHNLLVQVRRSIQLLQTSLKERIDFVRLGKNYIMKEVLRQNNRLIIYHTWYEKLYRDLATMEIKDQELADVCVEIAQFYKGIEDTAPLRIE